MKYLSDFVNGSVDGIITTFAIVAGTVGANLPLRTIIILGLANVIADAFSISASRYLTVKTDKEQGKTDKNPRMSALIVFCSFIAIGFLPLTAYFYSKEKTRLYIASMLISALSLFIVGYLKGIALEENGESDKKHNKFMLGLETLCVGGIAGVVAFFVGRGISRIS